jgi:hypothetical protein
VSVCEYAAPAKPEGKGEAVEMASWGRVMASENDWLAAPEAASVTLTLNVDVPTVVGTPATAPAEDMASPAGSAPEVSDQA